MNTSVLNHFIHIWYMSLRDIPVREIFGSDIDVNIIISAETSRNVLEKDLAAQWL